MANLCDYVMWRGDIPFTVRPFNAIDALVLCQLAYVNFFGIIPDRFDAGITLQDAARCYAKNPKRGSEFGAFINPLSADLLADAAETERFGTIILKGFVNEIDRCTGKQFAAITAVLPSGNLCVVYRGTDDTIIGWKEDFLLCLPDPIPSHTASVHYLSAAAKAQSGTLYVAGHSKGGNLALYAAGTVGTPVQKRIERVFCFDGPGFAFDIERQNRFQTIIPKIRSFIPQSSIVGVLLCYFPHYSVIESNESNIFWQHDTFSWQIKRDHFVTYEKGRSKESCFAEKTMQTWLSHLDVQERRKFIETLFEIMFSTGAETVSELTANGLSHSVNMLKELHSVDSKRKKELFTVIKFFFEAAYTHFPLGKQSIKSKNTDEGLPSASETAHSR